VIDKDKVLHIAKLARLHLNEQEASQYAKQLSDVLGYIDKLNQADTQGVEPMVTASPIETVYRADEPKMDLGVEEKIKNAPETSGHLIKVPPVVS